MMEKGAPRVRCSWLLPGAMPSLKRRRSGSPCSWALALERRSLRMSTLIRSMAPSIRTGKAQSQTKRTSNLLICQMGQRLQPAPRLVLKRTRRRSSGIKTGLVQCGRSMQEGAKPPRRLEDMCANSKNSWPNPRLCRWAMRRQELPLQGLGGWQMSRPLVFLGWPLNFLVWALLTAAPANCMARMGGKRVLLDRMNWQRRMVTGVAWEALLRQDFVATCLGLMLALVPWHQDYQGAPGPA
mmetsp:Transcript_125738/g.367421  ORF Transcript_125738/g.367421 Transcript_125738/m.367421 type:complete len:240 (+) Transcript_125738:659-1378(+)